MARLNIKYKLKQLAPGIVDSLMFDYVDVNLQKDHQAEDPSVFTNKEAYKLVTYDNTFAIKLQSHSTDALYEIHLTLWLVNELGVKTKDLTQEPLKIKVNAAGKADYNGPINWLT